ncbi:MAG: hypothetical protein HND48_05120 [Chloroflexi bacterium]|nr:hypothetical protein [Chloroflexota bacterium]
MAFRVIERLDHILTAISPQRSDNTAAAFGLGAFVVSLDRFRAVLQSHVSAHWANERPHRALLMIAAAFACSVPNAASAVDPFMRPAALQQSRTGTADRDTPRRPRVGGRSGAPAG